MNQEGKISIMDNTKELTHKELSSSEHIWHVWINRRQAAMKQEDPMHQWEHSLYEFKNLLEFLRYGHSQLRQAFEDKLPNLHQQCSHQSPIPILNNVLKCCLGTTVIECPILLSLKTTFYEETNRIAPDNGKKNYELPDEALYRLMAKTCAWHIYKEACQVGEGFHGVDTSEGHLMDTSDRMFWRNVYESLSYNPEETL